MSDLNLDILLLNVLQQQPSGSIACFTDLHLQTPEYTLTDLITVLRRRANTYTADTPRATIQAPAHSHYTIMPGIPS